MKDVGLLRGIRYMYFEVATCSHPCFTLFPNPVLLTVSFLHFYPLALSRLSLFCNFLPLAIVSDRDSSQSPSYLVRTRWM